MKPSPEKLLPIYRRNLARYEASGDADRIRVQRALIARLEGKVKK